MSLPSQGAPTGAIYGATYGLVRNLNWDINPQNGALQPGVEPMATGGGNLNGSANTANLLGHAGTAAQRIAVPRSSAGNYCGVI
jgi:hypothetical protein